MKPTGLNRGRGIQIFRDLDTLEKYLFEFVSVEGVKDQPASHYKKIKKTKKDEKEEVKLNNQFLGSPGQRRGSSNQFLYPNLFLCDLKIHWKSYAFKRS